MEAEKLAEAAENLVLSGVKNSTPHTQQSEMATKVPCDEQSRDTTKSQHFSTDGVSFDTKAKIELPEKLKGAVGVKNKRKRRRGRPKANSKPYKKSNLRFQMPRYRNGNCMRNKLVRSKSIVPYNTNGFLMDEHLAEVPSALLTPSGRTRDSSFSVDSEDNYFFSLPEDEEEFLTKDFDNAYEKTRVERLEGMSKQQLIEECLQLEDRSGIQQAATIEFLNKIRILEDRVRELSNENQDLRRKLDNFQKNSSRNEERIGASSSEDSESDSSSSSTSCGSSSYSSRCSSVGDMHESRMDAEDIDFQPENACNNSTSENKHLYNGVGGPHSPGLKERSTPASPASVTTSPAQRINGGIAEYD